MRICTFYFYFLVCLSVSGAEIAYPNHTLIGRDAKDSHVVYNLNTNDFITPTTVTFEYRNGKIISVIADYPKTVTLEMLYISINKDQAMFEKKFDKGIHIWRNEEMKYVMSIANVDGKLSFVLRTIDPELIKSKNK